MSERSIIGVCFCGRGEEYQDKICNGLINYAAELGNVRLIFYAGLFNSTDNKSFETGETSVFNLIDYDKLDGMIIMGLTFKDESIIKKIISECSAHNVKTVCYDYESEGVPSVSYNSFQAVYDLTSHLIEVHGCKKINFMAGTKSDELSVIRSNAYKKALSDHGIAADKRRIGEGYWWTFTAEKACEKWLNDGEEFDAVVCANDIMALSVINVLIRRGIRVPEDVKVVGLDNLEEGNYFDPQLTTAGFSYENDIGRALDMLIGKAEPENIKLGLHLFYRKSCGCDEAIKLDTNSYHRSIYETMDNINKNNEELFSLLSKMIECPFADQSFACLSKYLESVWAKELWVCVNKDLFLKEIELDADFETTRAVPKRYSKYVSVAAAKSVEDCGKEILTSELCPDLDKRLDECMSLMVFPLHINDSILGYVVKEHAQNFMMDRWFTFAMNLSSALLSVKQQNDMKLANRRLEEMYIRDSMTKIYNRRGFFRTLKSMMMTSVDKNMIVVSVDLDGLKDINDNYGHKEGDNAIIVTANSMTKAAGSKLVCARFGGDEFIAAGIYDENCGFVEKFNALIEEYNRSSRKPYDVSASVGCVIKRCESFKDFDDLIRLADEKMYLSKMSTGRGHCRETPRNDMGSSLQ